ncbi:MAG: hypothetical protein KA802_18280 [Saprospiraceae bacterium]|nr:hypothetical protein [Saprospiraceae bacterium]
MDYSRQLKKQNSQLFALYFHGLSEVLLESVLSDMPEAIRASMPSGKGSIRITGSRPPDRQG